MALSDRLRRQQIIREAEGYLDLVAALSDRWPVSPETRDRIAQRALRTLDRLAEPGGEAVRVLILRGEALRMQERYAEAVEPLEAAVKLEPENLHVLLGLGWCYKRVGRLDLAIEALEAALQADPTEAIVYYNLACYWSLARHKKHAIKYLSQALAIDSNYRDRTETEPDFDPIRSEPDFQALIGVSV
jgi:tetratricopeptide (TPR) repeat protein